MAKIRSLPCQQLLSLTISPWNPSPKNHRRNLRAAAPSATLNLDTSNALYLGKIISSSPGMIHPTIVSRVYWLKQNMDNWEKMDNPTITNYHYFFKLDIVGYIIETYLKK